MSVELRIELPDELLHPERFHVGHVDISDLAAGELIDDLAIMIDPVLLAHGQLVLDRVDGYVVAFATRTARNGECYGLIIQPDEQAIRIGRRRELLTVDRKQRVTLMNINARLGQGASISWPSVIA